VKGALAVRGFVAFLAEFAAFMRARKKFWLIPLMIMVLLLGGLVFLTEGSALAPFVYTIF
jgi:hypothetical protein